MLAILVEQQEVISCDLHFDYTVPPAANLLLFEPVLSPLFARQLAHLIIVVLHHLLFPELILLQLLLDVRLDVIESPSAGFRPHRIPPALTSQGLLFRKKLGLLFVGLSSHLVSDLLLKEAPRSLFPPPFLYFQVVDVFLVQPPHLKDVLAHAHLQSPLFEQVVVLDAFHFVPFLLALGAEADLAAMWGDGSYQL